MGTSFDAEGVQGASLFTVAIEPCVLTKATAR
jgi:hypothetical protein